jgi:sulfide:quinone oxidoreductase
MARDAGSGGKSVVVLGGGVGGVVAARELRKRLPRSHRVVLVDRRGTHRYQPSYLWLMVGDRRPQALEKDLAPLARKGIDLVRADVEAIDPSARAVGTTEGSLPYDALVVSLGAELAPDAVPGLAEAGETFYTLEGAARLYERLRAFRRGRLAVLVADLPFKCPAAPTEAALLLEAYVRSQGRRSDVAIDMYTPETLPMKVAGPAVGRQLVAMLEGKGIRFHPQRKVLNVDGATKQMRFEDGSSAPFDLLAYVPPHRAPRPVRESPLAGEGGWISVDRGTLRTAFDDVYAIGDVAALNLPSGMMLPKAGVFAHGEAKVVARNVAAAFGRGTPTTYDGHGSCWVEAGDGKAAFGSGDFFAAPMPRVAFHPPGRFWHWGKVLFEKYWMRRWA